jgi:RNA polymerase sigma factor (sigma-70 family)
MAKSPGVAEQGLPDPGLSADVTAEALFVRRYQRSVYGTALALLGDPDLAEAVAQEAFVRRWRSGSVGERELDGQGDWLLRTTRQLAVDVLCRRRRQSVDTGTPSGVRSGGAARTVAEVAPTAAPTGPVEAALDSLPPEQARAVLLAAWHGYTAQEIAHAEAVPLNAAKKRIRTGLQTMRAQLACPTCVHDGESAHRSWSPPGIQSPTD